MSSGGGAQANSSKDGLGVLWEDLEEVPIEVDEFDHMFSRPEVKSSKNKKRPGDANPGEEEAPAGSKGSGAAKNAVAKVLDPKRSQNIGIFLKSNHLEIQEVENTIYNFDNSVIDFEMLGQIRANQATPDELAAIRAQVEACPEIPLDKPEEFLLDLSKISHFNDRLECFMFQTRFSDALSDIELRLDNIKHICNMLVSNNSMKQVLSVILACGNYMNGGNTQRGQADGFAIDILPKLKDVKSRDNSTTLLQYVVRFCILRFDDKKGTAEATPPVPEPADVEKSGYLNFDDQRAECQRLAKDLDSIKRAKEIVVQESDPDHLEPFQTKMNKFLEEASGGLKEVQDLVDECSSKFLATMRFFKFVPKDGRVEDAQPKDFFCLWFPFCQDYKNIWKREQAKIAKDMIREERMRMQLKMASLKDFKTQPIKPMGLKDRINKRKKASNNNNLA